MEQFDEVELIDQINNKKQKPEAEIKKVKKNKNWGHIIRRNTNVNIKSNW